MKKIAYFLLLAAATSLTSCDKDTEETSTNFTQEITNIGSNVIIPTYKDLATAAENMHTAMQTLEANPTVDNLLAARNTWIAARVFWEQSEGFLFGPVDQEGIDPSLDSWPVNIVDLDNVLASSSTLTVEYLEQQEGTLKGFHTIEYLLWGANGDKQVSDITTRQFEYLTACSGALAKDAQRLYKLWAPEDGNFIDYLLTAGNGSNLYISEKAALEEIVNALVVIADEVGNSKINDPFAASDLTLEESRFSNNSKADFADNIRSIKNIYTGTYGTTGNGNSIDDVVREKNEALNTTILAQIDAAILAIESIDGTFTSAVSSARSSIETAQTAVRDLQETMESQLLPLISNL